MEYSEEEIPLLHLLPLLQRLTRLTDAHKQFGLTKSQMVVFIILYYRGSVTMSEIAQYICSSKEQATRAVASLCDSGWVERYEEPANRTHVYIRFTETGREYFLRLLAHRREELTRRLNSSLTEEDIHALRQSVRTTVEILNKVK